jgi:excisionase family DNA binding protein
MVGLATIRTLAALEQEMARTGRAAEKQALREALRSLTRPERGYLTTGQAADKLGVSIPTVKRWVERGALAGGPMGGRWLVATDSVEQLVRLRASLTELDREGNPTTENCTGESKEPPRARVSRPPALERVTLDTSALLGANRRYLIAATALRYYTAFWSSWIVGEFVRKRTEWIAERAAQEGCDLVTAP